MLKSSAADASCNFTAGTKPAGFLRPGCLCTRHGVPLRIFSRYTTPSRGTVVQPISTVLAVTLQQVNFLECLRGGQGWLSTICMNRTGQGVGCFDHVPKVVEIQKSVMTLQQVCATWVVSRLQKPQTPIRRAIMKRSSIESGLFVNLDKTQEQKLLELLPIDFKRAVKEGVGEYLADGMRFLVKLFMETEVNQLCGKRYKHKHGRKAVRWGSEPGTAIVGRTKEPIEKPRVRKRAGGKNAEVSLENLRPFNKRGNLSENILNSVLSGVSTRRYAGTVEKQLRKCGITKSSISRHLIEVSQANCGCFPGAALEELNLIALFIDGIHIGKRQVVVCIGVGYGGKKYVLGLRPGATENEVVCRDLLRDLKDRGLKEAHRYLFVIDGSQPLANAIRAAFGNDTAIQRCRAPGCATYSRTCR